MRGPQMRRTARAPTRSRPDRSSFAIEAAITETIAAPDLAAQFVATRYRLPLPLASLVARLAELGGALS
jgi:hypothetical protein